MRVIAQFKVDIALINEMKILVDTVLPIKGGRKNSPTEQEYSVD